MPFFMLRWTLLLLHMESIEFVVEDGEKAGGAGANSIIEWAATNYCNQLLNQSIYTGSKEYHF